MKSLIGITLVFLTFNLSKKCTKNKNAPTNLKKIVFCYDDSSVPPEYHRSYCIVVTSDKIHITVDSYGTILTDTIFPIRETDFQHLCQIFPSFNIEEQKETKSNKCVGGTSEKLTLYGENDSIILKGYIYYCGGEKYGNLKGDLTGFGLKIKELIPNFDSLLKLK